MQKAHSNINWENLPSMRTALNQQNLNKMDRSIDEIDNRVVTYDTTKFNTADAQTLVKNISFNKANGVFTITLVNGSSFTIDTLLEKLAVNFDFDASAQQLIIVLDDGSKKYVDLSALITQYEFLNSDTIAFAVQGDGKITAKITDGSITKDMLTPDLVADLEVLESVAANNQAILDEINKKLGLAEFNIDDDGNLVYTNTGGYVFTVGDDGNLYWRVA